MEHGPLRDLPEWLEEFTDNFLAEVPQVRLPQAPLVNRFIKTSDETGIGQALHFHALPERPTLRSMEEDQDYMGSWQ